MYDIITSFDNTVIPHVSSNTGDLVRRQRAWPSQRYSTASMLPISTWIKN